MNKNNNNKNNVVTLLAAWWLADCQHDKSNIAKQQNTDFDYVLKTISFTLTYVMRK